MRSATTVPPGSLVTRTFGIRSASFRSCVVFPEPSIPSSGMNMVARLLGCWVAWLLKAQQPSNLATQQPVLQPAKIMLAHQFLEDIIVCQKTKSLAQPGATAEPRELVLIGEHARLELVHAEEVAELGMLAIENRSRFADCVLPPRERVD